MRVCGDRYPSLTDDVTDDAIDDLSRMLKLKASKSTRVMRFLGVLGELDVEPGHSPYWAAVDAAT